MKMKHNEEYSEEKFLMQREKARKIIEDENKFEKFCADVSEKLKKVKLDERLECLPLMLKLVNLYRIGTYREIAEGRLLSIVGALSYFVLPIDSIPDFIPNIGYNDDIDVLLVSLKYVQKDLDNFKKWIDSNSIKKY